MRVVVHRHWRLHVIADQGYREHESAERYVEVQSVEEILVSPGAQYERNGCHSRHCSRRTSHIPSSEHPHIGQPKAETGMGTGTGKHFLHWRRSLNIPKIANAWRTAVVHAIDIRNRQLERKMENGDADGKMDVENGNANGK